jgi:hypothetical protein
MTPNTTTEPSKQVITRKGKTTGGRSKIAKLPTDVRESLWLDEVRVGTTIQTIARREQLSTRRVQHGVTRARLRELSAIQRNRATSSVAGGDADSNSEARNLPRLVPLFPIGPLTPSSTCGHHGPIRQGSVFCCMICHTSGMDDHPGLKRDPRTDPRPEPSVPLVAANGVANAKGSRRKKGGSANETVETRAERRKRRQSANGTSG